MQLHFGTDGIRGRANENLTNQMAIRIGQYLGANNKKGKVLIGRDTRLSGGMFTMALANGLTSTGADSYLLGVCSTPSLIYLVRTQGFDYGIMITASHNPYYDNGIKIIDNEGKKISAELEKAIEEYMYSTQEITLETGLNIGQIFDYKKGLTIYLDYLKREFPLDLSNYNICLDCANGSAVISAKTLLSSLGAKVDVINGAPDGFNINKECGSTHIEGLSQVVKTNNYDIGFAFDGDADRLIAVCGDGQICDGDKIIYCCGKYLKKKGQLNGNTVVTTVMANLGLFKRLDAEGIDYKKTQVGDKYVYKCMQENDYVLGGEQSGHIIFAKHATTGDGLLTALALLEVMISENKTLNQLTDDLFIYPQLLVNVEVNDKEKAMEDEAVLNICQQVEQQLNGNGRVLVRPSGTESLVRVMVEASNDDLCQKYCYQIVDVIKERNL